jgi:hypothetical protein
MGQVKQLVRSGLDVSDDVLIEETTREADQKTASDLLIHWPQPQTLAVRLRGSEYLRYADSFTFRTSGGSGMPELEKIRKGYAHFLFYGFTADGSIVKWMIADLSVFRRFFENAVDCWDIAPGQERQNKDGSSFRVFDFDQVARDERFVLAQGGLVAAQ